MVCTIDDISLSKIKSTRVRNLQEERKKEREREKETEANLVDQYFALA